MNTERKRDSNPPRLPEWFIQRMAWAEDRFSIQENLREEYADIASTRGVRSANIWYWRQMIRSLFPFVRFLIYWRFVMFTNYLKIVLRSMSKYKGYSFFAESCSSHKRGNKARKEQPLLSPSFDCLSIFPFRIYDHRHDRSE